MGRGRGWGNARLWGGVVRGLGGRGVAGMAGEGSKWGGSGAAASTPARRWSSAADARRRKVGSHSSRAAAAAAAVGPSAAAGPPTAAAAAATASGEGAWGQAVHALRPLGDVLLRPPAQALLTPTPITCTHKRPPFHPHPHPHPPTHPHTFIHA